MSSLSAGSGPRRGTTRRGLSILSIGMREQRRLFSLALIGSLVFGALTVADAWILGWATDNVIAPSFDEGELEVGLAVTVIALFMGVAVLRAFGIIARRLIGGIVYFRLLAEYRRRVTRRYLELPMSWHHKHPTGQLLSNANADVEAVWEAMMPLPMALGVIAMLVVAVIAMLTADVVLTLVGLVIFPLLFAINVGYQRFLSERVSRAQALRADVSAVAHESFDGAMVVKALGRETAETERFAQVSYQLRDANIAAGKIRSVFDPIVEALPSIGVMLVVVLGVERVLSGATEPGSVVQVAYLFTVIAFPLRAFGWVLGGLPRTVIGWERVQSVLTARGRADYGDAGLPGTAALRLRVRDLTFGYDRGGPVLDGLDFEVEPGRTVAVVGLTGSGKSTLAELLIRLVDPVSGAVELDGIDARDLTHAELAGAVTLVPQHAFMFDDSIRENVTLGLPVDDEAVWEALRTAQADRFVHALPGRLDGQLGERGTTLSGGQRQRIALARALVRRPRLLILDDATSAVDPEVEARILAGLRDRTRGGETTVVVVAYRKATIALADEVLFLEAGRIADRGPHAELVTRSSAYRDLVDAYDLAREAADQEAVEVT
ncbi:MAG TPA: ABC transporter ATP-binding protein [Nocardioidaceae bacterium]|nr:ABC transporter ATP-binding protein [Nocardioidaceae bacterium]